MSSPTLQMHNQVLNERDIRLFLKEAPRFNPLLKFGAIAAAMIVLLGGASYGLLNYNALLALYSQPTLAAVPLVPVSTPDQIYAGLSDAPTPAPTPWPAATITKNSLSAGSLNIAAPISWDVPFDNDQIDSMLPNGLVHFQGTAKPGQQGYVIITGHSSNYPWIKGAYNSIFAPLRKAQTGQQIVLNFENHEYTYQVTKVFEVKPDDLSVLNSGEGNGLRLITCTPIGTSLRRLIVEAQQISPAPDYNSSFTAQTFTGSLPGTL